MPWTGFVSIEVKVPESTQVALRLPVADWMLQPKFSLPTRPNAPGFVEVVLDASTTQILITFGLETRLLRPNPRVGQDTLSVSRGPIIFVAEDVDNSDLDNANPHFELVGISESAKFTAIKSTIAGVPILQLSTDDVYVLNTADGGSANGVANGGVKLAKNDGATQSLYATVNPDVPTRSWSKFPVHLTFVPWFARGNRGGKGHLRVPFFRVGQDKIQQN
ncbi:hypothetical protein SEUCBS139899_003391 [Sporothrix eucalyptigena]